MGMFFTLALTGALAQDTDSFPTRTVTIIVPGGAGGPVDVGARLLAEYLKAEWSVPVVIENKLGGGGNVASAYVSKAVPDGHTLLANLDSIAANVALYKNTGYDLKAGFAPVAMIAITSPVIAVSPQLGVKTMSEFVSLAKSRGTPIRQPRSGNNGPSLECPLAVHIQGQLDRCAVCWRWSRDNSARGFVMLKLSAAPLQQ
jgi:tripartite-type tricarboxylate transporter receptor subunit TctC